MRRFEHAGKFWSVDLDESSVRVRWGNIGSAGQRRDLWCPDEAAAKAKLADLVAKQVALGYVEVGGAALLLARMREGRAWTIRLVRGDKYLTLSYSKGSLIERRGTIGGPEETDDHGRSTFEYHRDWATEIIKAALGAGFVADQ